MHLIRHLKVTIICFFSASGPEGALCEHSVETPLVQGVGEDVKNLTLK